MSTENNLYELEFALLQSSPNENPVLSDILQKTQISHIQMGDPQVV